MKKKENKEVFVFGSNLGGIHGAGAALTALKDYGAVMGRGEGMVGRSYAIPTKNQYLRTLALSHVEEYIRRFIQIAKNNPDLVFKVTQIGCGLAGFTPNEIAPLFRDAPMNCTFDKKWEPYLGSQRSYWGTF